MIPLITEGQTFDSELQRAERFGLKGPDAQDVLFLRMRVKLVQVNPPKGKPAAPFKSSEGTTFQIQRWSDADWQLFCNRYEYLATEHWNGNFQLVPSPRIRAIKRMGGELRTAVCCFNLNVVKDSKQAHQTIPVVKLGDDQPKFRSDAGLYCSRDVWKELLEGTVQTPNGPVQAAWNHVTILHEVGHLLGLDHPNAANVKDPNEHLAYGSTMLQRMGTMGSGPVQKLNYASPWIQRIARHTQTREEDWMPFWLGNAEHKGRDLVVKAG